MQGASAPERRKWSILPALHNSTGATTRAIDFDVTTDQLYIRNETERENVTQILANYKGLLHIVQPGAPSEHPFEYKSDNLVYTVHNVEQLVSNALMLAEGMYQSGVFSALVMMSAMDTIASIMDLPPDEWYRPLTHKVQMWLKTQVLNGCKVSECQGITWKLPRMAEFCRIASGGNEGDLTRRLYAERTNTIQYFDLPYLEDEKAQHPQLLQQTCAFVRTCDDINSVFEVVMLRGMSGEYAKLNGRLAAVEQVLFADFTAAEQPTWPLVKDKYVLRVLKADRPGAHFLGMKLHAYATHIAPHKKEVIQIASAHFDSEFGCLVTSRDHFLCRGQIVYVYTNLLQIDKPSILYVSEGVAVGIVLGGGECQSPDDAMDMDKADPIPGVNICFYGHGGNDQHIEHNIIHTQLKTHACIREVSLDKITVRQDLNVGVDIDNPISHHIYWKSDLQ